MSMIDRPMKFVDCVSVLRGKDKDITIAIAIIIYYASLG